MSDASDERLSDDASDDAADDAADDDAARELESPEPASGEGMDVLEEMKTTRDKCREKVLIARTTDAMIALMKVSRRSRTKEHAEVLTKLNEDGGVEQYMPYMTPNGTNAPNAFKAYEPGAPLLVVTHRKGRAGYTVPDCILVINDTSPEKFAFAFDVTPPFGDKSLVYGTWKNVLGYVYPKVIPAYRPKSSRPTDDLLVRVVDPMSGCVNLVSWRTAQRNDELRISCSKMCQIAASDTTSDVGKMALHLMKTMIDVETSEDNAVTRMCTLFGVVVRAIIKLDASGATDDAKRLTDAFGLKTAVSAWRAKAKAKAAVAAKAAKATAAVKAVKAKATDQGASGSKRPRG